MWNRRIKETIGIRYDDCTKMNGIVESIRSYLKEHEAIDQKMITIVAFNEFGPSSLNILVYCFTKTTDWLTFHGIKQEVLLGIADIISKAGAEIAFPTRTLHIADLPSSPEGLSAALANDS
jgi:MscS family membrane protein